MGSSMGFDWVWFGNSIGYKLLAIGIGTKKIKLGAYVIQRLAGGTHLSLMSLGPLDLVRIAPYRSGNPD